MKGTFKELFYHLGNGNTMLFREDKFEKKYCFPSDGVQEITKENATSKYLKHIFEKEKCENIEDIYISNRIDCVSIPNNGIPYLNVNIVSKFFNSDDIWELITIDNNKQ